MNENDSGQGISRRQFVELGLAGAGALALGMTAAAASDLKRARLTDKMPLTLAWFLRWQIHMPDAAFEPLLSLVSRHQSVIDELALYDTPGNAWFPSLETCSKAAEVMARRLESFRKVGIKSLGVTVINVIGGQSKQNQAGAPDIPFPKMVGLDGKETDLNGCPNRPEMKAYTREKFAIVARIAPDFIWVSDDMRMQSHGEANWGCFCPVCLQLFSQQVGQKFTREELVSALDDPGTSHLRAAWVEHNARTIESVYATIGEAIHDTNPRVQTGMMTLGMDYTGYSGTAYERWFKALRATKARPGQLFYWDSPPGRAFDTSRMGLLIKALEVSRQTETYSALVQDRQYEYESWPDGRLIKDPQTALNEIVVALAVGCNGAALATLGWGPPFDEYLPLLERLHNARPYLESVLRHGATLPAAGLWSAWSPQIFAKRRVRSGEHWLSSDTFSPALAYDMNVTGVLAQVGIPLSARRSQYGAILTGRIIETLDDAELRSILGGGVLMDTVALRVIIERALGDLTGVRIEASDPELTTARMTMDSFNGPYGGALHWAVSPAGFNSNDVLTSVAPGVRGLVELEDELGRKRGLCMTAFENSEGGRVVVSGFAAWWFLQSAGRRFQMLEIADWISRHKVPVRIKEVLPLTPFVRMNAEGTKGLVVLLNTGLSPIELATVLIRAPRDTQVRLASVGKDSALQRFDNGADWGVRVTNVPPWSTVSLLIG
jgi:hypothetical protein